jgi:hypothetical protein
MIKRCCRIETREPGSTTDYRKLPHPKAIM